MLKKKIFSLSLVSMLFLGSGSLVKAEVTSNVTHPSISYTVASGDSLWKISQNFKTTISSIMSMNGLTSSYIFPGQVLKVQDNTVSIYTVVAGDTLWIISKKLNITVDLLMELNNLTSSTIYPGQSLKVSTSSTTVTPAPSQPVTQTVNYKVLVGDTLWGVAKKYNTTMDAILKSNMLVSNILMPGQILTIPVNSTNIVKPIGITKYLSRTKNSYGDVYTWENAMRLWTVGTVGTIKDIGTGKTFKVKYYGGSNHSDIVTLTQADTDIMKSIYGDWSWLKMRPVILYFEKGGVNYQLAASLTGMPHGNTDNSTNGMAGHTDLYFYNSTSHNTNEISPAHQSNVIRASGR